MLFREIAGVPDWLGRYSLISQKFLRLRKAKPLGLREELAPYPKGLRKTAGCALPTVYSLDLLPRRAEVGERVGEVLASRADVVARQRRDLVVIVWSQTEGRDRGSEDDAE